LTEKKVVVDGFAFTLYGIPKDCCTNFSRALKKMRGGSAIKLLDLLIAYDLV